MNLFLHMPKCAGTSLREMIAQTEPGRLITDYNSHFRLPPAERAQRLGELLRHPQNLSRHAIVFGHFFPVKYLGDNLLSAENSNLVTILRGPLQRAYSHYKFWNALQNVDHFIWKKMKTENWSFEEFALSDEMKSIYAQYLAHTPLGAFSYIGVYENLQNSIWNCLNALGLSQVANEEIPKSNVTPGKGEFKADPGFLREFRAFHHEDYLIYGYALAKFHQ
ncbi:hypothetical protein KMP13_07505 [Epibacterium ulvae]|uniref:hypothetical protein n=1 Tax=Epibacterium ulvae TaxID=1156985 RepID=UPI001BFC9F3B|nr:hypothetical protein [Epibacterium ulvae]MBT8153745.1 hypothetical protein [Epibacterium ulvae]